MTAAFDDAADRFTKAAANLRRLMAAGVGTHAAYKDFREAHAGLLREGRDLRSADARAVIDAAGREANRLVRQHAAIELDAELQMEHQRTVRAWGASAFDLNDRD